MDLKKTFTVSDKSFIVLILSGILLYISTKIVINNQYALISYLCHKAGSSINYSTYARFFDATFLMGLAALLVSSLLYASILIMRPGEKHYERNSVTEAFTYAVSGFNLIYSAIILSLIILKYFIPLPVFLLIIVGFTVSVFLLAYKLAGVKSSKNEAFHFPLWNSIDSSLMKHNFKNFQLIFVLAFLFPFYSSAFSFLIWGKVLPLLQIIGAVIAFIGVVYLMAARIYKYRKMDEFQKRVMLEHSFIFFNIFIFLLFSLVVVSWSFRINVEFTSVAYPTFLLVAISSVIVENKYK